MTTGTLLWHWDHLLPFFDLHSLGTAALVCREWRAQAHERVRHALRGNAPWAALGTADQRVVKASVAALTGPLIGIGGMSRVYELWGLPELCVKVCVGGRYVRTCDCTSPFDHFFADECSKADAQCKAQAGDVLEAMYRWTSATTDLCGRITREDCNRLLRGEYRILCELCGRGTGRPQTTLFPRPLFCGVDSDRGCHYYVMERLRGLTLKQFLQCTIPVPSGCRSVSVRTAQMVDLLMPFLALLRSLERLHGATRGAMWHGDVKPANVLLCGSPAADGEAEVTVRLIDPVARPSTERSSAEQFLTVEYNPKAYMQVFADTFGLALCMLEVLCNEQPFQGFVREREPDVDRGLQRRLADFKAQWAEHPMVHWLCEWIDTDITHFRGPATYPGSIPPPSHRSDATKTYANMANTLDTFRAAGFTLAREWKRGATQSLCGFGRCELPGL